MGVFDLIAKRDIPYTKQFNGTYGCSICLNPGTLISRNTRAYLPGHYELRTHPVVTAAKEAEHTGEAVQGVISTSSKASIINLVDSVPVDYMHAVLEGVTCTLLNAWFLSCNHGEPYYLEANLPLLISSY